MKPEHRALLTLTSLPARLDAEQAAWHLGSQPHDVPVLIAADLLRPLGRPQHNAVKYFAAVELQALRADSRWLAKATDAVQSRGRWMSCSDSCHRNSAQRLARQGRHTPVAPTPPGVPT